MSSQAEVPIDIDVAWRCNVLRLPRKTSNPSDFVGGRGGRPTPGIHIQGSLAASRNRKEQHRLRRKLASDARKDVQAGHATRQIFADPTSRPPRGLMGVLNTELSVGLVAFWVLDFRVARP